MREKVAGPASGIDLIEWDGTRPKALCRLVPVFRTSDSEEELRYHLSSVIEREREAGTLRRYERLSRLLRAPALILCWVPLEVGACLSGDLTASQVPIWIFHASGDKRWHTTTLENYLSWINSWKT